MNRTSVTREPTDPIAPIRVARKYLQDHRHWRELNAIARPGSPKTGLILGLQAKGYSAMASIWRVFVYIKAKVLYTCSPRPGSLCSLVLYHHCLKDLNDMEHASTK